MPWKKISKSGVQEKVPDNSLIVAHYTQSWVAVSVILVMELISVIVLVSFQTHNFYII